MPLRVTPGDGGQTGPAAGAVPRHRQGGSQSHLCITAAASTTQVGQIGQSVQGRALVYIKLSAGVDRRKLLEPMVKYVGNMHGNEAVSRWNNNSIFFSIPLLAIVTTSEKTYSFQLSKYNIQ